MFKMLPNWKYFANICEIAPLFQAGEMRVLKIGKTRIDQAERQHKPFLLSLLLGTNFTPPTKITSMLCLTKIPGTLKKVTI